MANDENPASLIRLMTEEMRTMFGEVDRELDALKQRLEILEAEQEELAKAIEAKAAASKVMWARYGARITDLERKVEDLRNTN
ncbi:flagellar biosynthesis chaperone FliJ [Rhizobium sp. SG_E_25_P2]|jgi:flagellar biosynthesis chaperone FliJ|uniref:hypothetical protein n=1 Tax=Rhizobium sp. SG_E_25_P2 TaxID=2879942 RepID=UPI0024742201|nr:hypothetical protein [Rhizobium sp. SG_E_25_P2]MDH6268817.1 flagellar biosynthesis chaperone FliJ [Rhizobium sp. SG_E_25_P2]